MNDQEIQELIDKYLDGTATPRERERILTWYRQRNEEEIIWETDSADEESEIKEGMFASLSTQVATTKSRSSRLRYISIAAKAAVLVGLAIGSVLWLRDGVISDTQIEAPSVSQVLEAPLELDENRFLLLPDSSKVLLRAGSTLEYVTDFSGATREVSLTGEAYFDINRREGQPFIIHTGKLKTTVLGTIFTIKADGVQDEVVVAVKQGKVRVEDSATMQVELSADQQLVYNDQIEAPQKQEFKVAEVLSWTGKDMSFDNLPFRELANRLARRYGVSIDFAHGGLENCPISGRFDGTESLEEVLDILSLVRNTAYHKIGENFLISGKGCDL